MVVYSLKIECRGAFIAVTIQALIKHRISIYKNELQNYILCLVNERNERSEATTSNSKSVMLNFL
jgi:hypothetical protein